MVLVWLLYRQINKVISACDVVIIPKVICMSIEATYCTCHYKYPSTKFDLILKELNPMPRHYKSQKYESHISDGL